MGDTPDTETAIQHAPDMDPEGHAPFCITSFLLVRSFKERRHVRRSLVGGRVALPVAVGNPVSGAPIVR